MVIGIVDSFHAKIDETREVWESLGEASKPTAPSAAKEHYKAELLQDDMARSVGFNTQTEEFPGYSRSVYARKLRLLVAGKVDGDEAEALIG